MYRKNGNTSNYEFVCYDRVFETSVTLLGQNVPIHAFKSSSYKEGENARIYTKLILSHFSSGFHFYDTHSASESLKNPKASLFASLFVSYQHSDKPFL